jgi:hypothetical protein
MVGGVVRIGVQKFCVVFRVGADLLVLHIRRVEYVTNTLRIDRADLSCDARR